MFCLAAGERLGVAASMRHELRAVTAVGGGSPFWLDVLWPLGMVAAGVLGLVVGRVLYETVEERRAQRRRTFSAADRVADAQAVRFFSRAAVALWCLWQLSAYLVYHGYLGASEPMTVLHMLAIGAALIALGGAGRAIGDVRVGWDRASVVRLQLLALGALAAAFFLVGVTADQVADVLRAWADGRYEWSRAAYGIAAALLLGALLRASSQRLLFPDEWSRVRTRSIDRGAAALGAVVLVPVLCGWTGAGSLALALVVVVTASTSRWGEAIEPREDVDKAAIERLPGSLGVAPVGILFAGISGALLDSALLESPAAAPPTFLFVETAVAGLVLAMLVARAHIPLARAEGGDARVRWSVKAAIFVAGGLFAALAGFGGVSAAVLSLVLLAGAAVIATGITSRWGATEFAAAAGVLAGTLIAVYVDPVGSPRAYGAVGVALVGLAGIMLLLHFAGAVGARRHPRGFLAKPWLPVRLPVVGLLAAWIGVAWSFGPPTLHQARTVESEAQPVALRQAVHAWLDRRTEGGEATRVPMVLLAASGGGAKAAYWTDLVLDCLASDAKPDHAIGECPKGDRTARRRLDQIFLTSSVSGGSAGVYHYVRNRQRAFDGDTWVRSSAGREVLSPIVAWGFFHDLPAFLLGAELDPSRCLAAAADEGDEWNCMLHADRAVAQEAALTGSDGDLVPDDARAVLDGEGPLTIFNAALDGANGRVLTSPVELAPPRVQDCDTPWTGAPAAGSIDGHDLLEPKTDVPLVTAALLSARFPVVAPAARLGEADPSGRGCHPPPDPLPPAKLRDGGYVENSGLLTITELLPAVRAAIDTWKPPSGARPQVPVVVVSVDDDPVVHCADPEHGEARGEALGIAGRAGPGYLTRLARDRLESGQYPGVQYVRISPPPHVGAQAATGWELSETARRDDLMAALRHAGGDGRTGRFDAGARLVRLREAIDRGALLRCPGTG